MIEFQFYLIKELNKNINRIIKLVLIIEFQFYLIKELNKNNK
jgi:hypothetical protein